MPERLTFSVQQLTKNAQSFAIWRMPNSANVQSVVCNAVKEFSFAAIENNAKGFVFAPFDSKAGTTSLFLEGEIVNTTLLAEDTALQDFYIPNNTNRIETPESFKINVEKAIAAIGNNQMKKVVLARNVLWHIPNGFFPIRFFNTLCKQYPNAFISLVSIKDMGTWVGATPELLLRADSEQLSTVALAGTQPIGSKLWSEKESEEQLWVLRYIEEILAEYQVDEVNVSPRKLIANGDIEHLYTEIGFKKNNTSHQALAAHILYRLHPTPAVCGITKEKAIQFIQHNEKFDRCYYAGFLGSIGYGGVDLFVNLRCMQITKQGIVAYAGAGITQDSDAEKELIETKNKLEVLRRFL